MYNILKMEHENVIDYQNLLKVVQTTAYYDEFMSIVGNKFKMEELQNYG